MSLIDRLSEAHSTTECCGSRDTGRSEGPCSGLRLTHDLIRDKSHCPLMTVSQGTITRRARRLKLLSTRQLVMLKSATSWSLLIVLTMAAPALAQLQNGQMSNGPRAPIGITPSPASPLSNSTLQEKPGFKPTPPALTGGAVVAPPSTVGNTPSSLQGGLNNTSGYSATGSTVNGNINNTAVGNRSPGQPVGGGSQTSTSNGMQTTGALKH
jgi:hypothetical protein